ncbi:uncharacterized protein involved in exopolysaccharide biosynthesis [Paraburkholderia sp. Clong3]|uniref:Wzz/FepE/Etk N-terminal domain-containing protein n=1 Tax=Paraburkholderia sp. Clong3 TaxID=2991061 RepID=UPI003D218E1D
MNTNTGRGALNQDEGEDIDFSSLIDTLVNDWRRIAVSALVVFVVACAYMVVAKPVFQSSILIEVEDNPDASAKNLLGDISSLFNVKASSDAEIQILGSMMIVGGTVDNLALFVDAKPKYFPLLGRFIARHNSGLSTPGLLGWGGYAWGTESIEVPKFDVPRTFEDDKFTLLNLGEGRYRIDGSDLDHAVEDQVGRSLVIQTAKGPITLEVKNIYAKPGAAFSLTRHARLETIPEG